jgi:hypothetical protein
MPYGANERVAPVVDRFRDRFSMSSAKESLGIDGMDSKAALHRGFEEIIETRRCSKSRLCLGSGRAGRYLHPQSVSRAKVPHGAVIRIHDTGHSHPGQI